MAQFRKNFACVFAQPWTERVPISRHRRRLARQSSHRHHTQHRIVNPTEGGDRLDLIILEHILMGMHGPMQDVDIREQGAPLVGRFALNLGADQRQQDLAVFDAGARIGESAIGDPLVPL